jgi:hypothetical protein
MVAWLRPGSVHLSEIHTSQLNAHFMAGWVGLVITGLNMWPVSQLDGGHVVYAMFGPRAHWVARIFVVSSMLYIAISKTAFWTLMLLVVIMLGIKHPPTADDSVPLGPWRHALGWMSLLIPIVCCPPAGLRPG